MSKKRVMKRLPMLLLALLTVLFGAGGTVFAGENSVRPAFYTWDPADPIGSAQLVRTDAGLTATFLAHGLPPGQAVTMWFIFVNNPEECATSPCGDDDFFLNPAVEWDFHWGAGNVIGGSGQSGFGGHLRVGDVSGSGNAEFGLPAVALTNPLGAEVHLVLHSHGPKQSGRNLKSQLNSFLGGCQVFLGDVNGFAQGPGDIPVNPGECVSFAFSIHQ